MLAVPVAVVLFCTGLLIDVFLQDRSDLWEMQPDKAERTLLAALVVVVAVAAVELHDRFDIEFLGWTTAGMSPVLVLTMGPRLILTLTVLLGPTGGAFGPLLILLLGSDKVVGAALEKHLPVCGCLFGGLVAVRLDLRDTIEYVLVAAGLWFSFVRVGSLSAAGLAF